MVAESFDKNIEKAVAHYSSLFTLPSFKAIVLANAIICLTCGVLTTFALSPSLLYIIEGLFLGFSIFSLTLLTDIFLRASILKGDPLCDLRRLTALSFFCMVLWLSFTAIGVIASFFFGFIWSIRLCLLGFSSALILRFIVLYTASSVTFSRFCMTLVFQPFICLIPFAVFWSSSFNVWRVILFSFSAFAICFVSSYSFAFIINRIGIRSVGVPSLSIFKTFLLNWVAGLNQPLEAFLEMLGQEREIEVSVLRFDNYKGKTEAFIAIPSVHPGPFKNIGSSLLPSMLKATLDQKYECVSCVPLGIVEHDLDVASQFQNQKIIDYTVRLTEFEADETRTTPFIKISNGIATACCQIFGKTALISLSLAPNTTEDLPQELDSFIRLEAGKKGFYSCVVINAHNSINGTLSLETAVKALKNVTVACLSRAISTPPFPFKIGAATVKPKEFGLKEGMGPGGITSILIEVSGRKNAYIVIDANNMVSGLREKILSALKSIGIEEGEVLTTDTHSVNALTLTKRGYHPIGEVVDHERIIGYVNEAARNALANLRHAKVGYRKGALQNVKVIGRDTLEKLCSLPDKAVQKAKRISVPIFAFAYTLLMLLSFFL
ncbi:MAG: DUF2070 family protein [Candidatus Bathyarchaeia archaeon]